jgi:hypothetical protein
MKTCGIFAFVFAALLHPSLAAAGQLGSVSFPTSGSPEAQTIFEQGVALLHSFQYEEADQTFDEAVRRDSRCAMCHWGKAMALYHQIWDWPTRESLARGRQEIRLAQTIGVHTSRERAYIAAAATFFQDRANLRHADRIRAYSRRMAAIHREYRDDTDAASFYALSLIALSNEGIDRLKNQRRAIDVLAPLLRKQRNHPGVAHYLIHAADRPELARLGLEAARMYADIAPDSSHALHMPSHIFVRLGLWEETIALNLRAAASGAHAAMEHRGDYTYQIHAMDYLRYAYLQRGLESKARALHAELTNVPAASDDEKAADRAYFAGRTAIELHRWSEAAGLPIPDLGPSWLSDTFWARAIGAARSGDVNSARESLVRLRDSVKALQAGRDPQSQLNQEVPVAQLEAEGWVAFAEGNRNEALNYLRRAAEREAKDVGESVAVPAREMLADLLLEIKRPAESLAAYKMTLKAAPNRFNALLGAARSSEAMRAPAQARDYYRHLIAVADFDADRPEVKLARAYLAR